MADDDKDVLQLLAGEAAKFFSYVGETIGDPQAKAALIQDLGGNPSMAPDSDPFPTSTLDSITAYRDAANPTAEAGVQAIADIATVLDFIGSQVETWEVSAGAGAQELAHGLLDLLMTNYVRLRWPRLFLVIQGLQILEDITSTYGEGSNNGIQFVNSLKALGGFILQPGKSLEAAESATTPPDNVARYTDLAPRITAGALGWFLKKKQEAGRPWVVEDVFTGWDGRGLDVDSPVAPTKADLISMGMSSFSFGDETAGPSTDPSAAGQVFVTLAMVPKSIGGRTALFIAVGGSADIEQPIGDRWVFSAKVRADAAVAAMVPPFRLVGPDGGGNFSASIGYASQPDEATGLSFALPSRTGTRLELGQVAVSLTLTSTGAEMLLTIADSAFVIDSSDNDGFVSELLGHTPLRLAFGGIVGYSSSRGLVLEGYAGPPATPAQPPAPLSGSGNVGPPVIAMTIPIGRGYGPLTLHEVSLRLTHGPADVPPAQMTEQTLEVDTSFSAQIGPLYLRLDQLGLLFTVDDSKPPEQRNLRLIDLSLGVKAPRGVAVQVDTSFVTGGGSILHDPDQGIYFGSVDLALRGSLVLKAIGLVSTRLPDGKPGFSLIVLVTAEFNGYPLGMGFFLQGLGGLLALHRTFDETAMRTALPTGQLRNVLFPSDPIHHTTEVLHSLQSLFPAQRGSHMFGVLVKIGWARPTLVQFELGVIYQWGNQHRLIILGRVSAILPRPDLAILKLNMDALGLLDFDAGMFALDATLFDSRLSGRFVLTGAMAMRMAWHGSTGFALAVGGLHPKFTAPAGFPSVARLQLALTNGDNPKLICQSYFAVTSNTVQFGSDCSLYASAYGFSITGDVGFDVLIQLLPFHFIADFRASVQLKRGSHNLFKLSVTGELEGPLPLRLAGKASFEILWCDFTVSFNATLVDGGTPNDVPRVDVFGVISAALSDPTAWQTQLPSATGQLVGHRQIPAESVLLHPLGTLSVRQNVVPLNLSRDIDRVGTGTPTGERRFSVTNAGIGSLSQTPVSVKELFAPAQFFDMSDDDKLAAPSFESMDAGVSFGDAGYALDAATQVSSAFDYTDIVIGTDGSPVLQPDPHTENGSRVMTLTMLSAAGGAPTRRTLDQRFAAPVSAAAPTVSAIGWAAVSPTGAPSAMTTWAEARGQAMATVAPAAWVIVPASELVAG